MSLPDVTQWNWIETERLRTHGGGCRASATPPLPHSHSSASIDPSLALEPPPGFTQPSQVSTDMFLAPDQDEVQIAQDVSLEDFKAAANATTQFKLAWRNGTVFAHERATELLQSASFAVENQLVEFSEQYSLKIKPHSPCILEHENQAWEVDLATFCQKELTAAGAVSRPTLICDIGFNDSLEYLQRRVGTFFELWPFLQIILILKVFPARSDGSRVMLAVQYRRQSLSPERPTDAISFGGAPPSPAEEQELAMLGLPPLYGCVVGIRGTHCDAPGIPTFQLQLLTSELFAESSELQQIPLTVNLDLFPIQQAILHATQKE